MHVGKDDLYARPLGNIAAFSFDARVAEVFADMIQRSVPGYAVIVSAIGLLAGRFATPGSVCFDLGCSLGAAALAMRREIHAENCRIVAVDNSPAMIERLRRNLEDEPGPSIEVCCADVRELPIANASVVVLNFTLQFIPPADRAALLARIHAGLLPGGILILSEKLAFADPRQQVLQTDLHHLFKQAQGYSELEVSQKRTALESVLVPETFETHRGRLAAAGFASVEIWFQYFNFASMIALK